MVPAEVAHFQRQLNTPDEVFLKCVSCELEQLECPFTEAHTCNNLETTWEGGPFQGVCFSKEIHNICTVQVTFTGIIMRLRLGKYLSEKVQIITAFIQLHQQLLPFYVFANLVVWLVLTTSSFFLLFCQHWPLGVTGSSTKQGQYLLLTATPAPRGAGKGLGGQVQIVSGDLLQAIGKYINVQRPRKTLHSGLLGAETISL